MSDSKKKRSKKKKKSAARMRRNMLLGVCVLTLATVIGSTCWYLNVKKTVDQFAENAVWDNISVDGENVSGMTEDELRAFLVEKQEELGLTTVNLKVEGETIEVALSDLGFEITNTEEIIEQAVFYGKEGSVFNRYKQMKALENRGLTFGLEYKVDSALAAEVISSQVPEFENGAKDATLTRKNGQFIITDEVVGITVDAEASAKVIEAYFSEEWNQGNAEIELVTKVDEPTLTKEILSQVTDVLGTFTTYAGGTGTNRVANIRRGVNLINGAVVMPGEVFSADMAMRPYTAANGFAEAGAYQNGKVIQSMGGGICQVSSTLYNAAILAELGVAQRQPHSMLVDYVQPSMDAAIAGDYKDFKLENTTDAPIYIEGYVSNGYVTFKIYGKETRSANRTIKFVSETLSTKDPGKKFEASEDALGTIVKTSSAHVGMEARLWKVVYENGKEVSREIFNTSSYMASPAYYTVGTATTNAEAKAIVKAAIATNDEAKINAAIAQAKEIIAAANRPVEPEIPDTPEVPDTPDVPETPDTPEVPETPETPETPEATTPEA